MLPFELDEADLLATVARALEAAFGGPSSVLPQEPLPAFAYRDDRGQYCSTEIIHWLAAHRSVEGSKLIAVIDRDLFSPIFTFVFGEAGLGKDAAIFSTFRLRNEHYGLPPDQALLKARAAKEAVHEVGHLFGLKHCRDPQCVMRFSSSVEFVDLKEAALCDACGIELRRLRGQR